MAYLIKNAHLYNPDDMGVQDVLVVNDKVAAIGKDLTVVLPDLEMVDAKGMIMTPGFIDQHIHVTGGGGEGGPKSRTPEIVLSELVECGTTSLVGVSGTDSVSRSIPNLLAKVQALTDEGVSAWMYTSNYAYPPTTLTGSVKNDLLMVHEVLGVKIALGDHRSSFPTTQQVLDLLTQIRVGGMIAGKIGVLHIHLGNVPGAFEMFEDIVNRGFPISVRRTALETSMSLVKRWNLVNAAAASILQRVVHVPLKARQMQLKRLGTPVLISRLSP